MGAPLAYFVTWTTYGTWLRGDARGSIVGDNRFGAPHAERDNARQRHDEKLLTHEPVRFGDAERTVVEATIREVCEHRDWRILALACRTNHVHVVVAGSATPERMMNQLKSWSTRRLREANLVEAEGRVWTTHGSTRHLFDAKAVASAVHYVEHQ